MKKNQRDGFNSRIGFILACVGSAVGMGNLWRFPVMVSKYGGLTFIIPFFIFVILIAATGVIEEFTLGRSTKNGPIGAFGACTKLKWNNGKIGRAIGVIPVLGALGMAIGYTCVMAWTFKYAWMAITGDMAAMSTDTQLIADTFNNTATSFGANIWVIVAIVFCFIIMFMGVSKGIEIANKFMMPFLFLLFFGLAIYIATLDGASNGYKYILTFNPEGFADPEIWIFAFGQAFFSLSIGGNGSVIYGSYLSEKENIPQSALVVAIFDVVSAMLAACVIMPAMGTCGVELDQGGPGLMFIYLVNVFNSMATGRIVSIAFFVAVIFAGMSSIINMYETPVAVLQDTFKLKRKPSTLIILLIGCASALFVQGITSDWMDIMSIYVCPLGAVLAAIMFFWIAGKKFALENVNKGAKKKIGKWFFPLGKYVYVSLALAALVLGAALGGIG